MGKLYHQPKQMFPNTIHLFTDGSCWRGDKSGGWGVVLLYNQHKKEIFGGKPDSTNNQMELMAILEGLKAIKTRDKKVIVYSDSQYCINCVTAWHKGWARNGWKTANGEDVKNVELIKEIVSLIHDNISFKWVKGHIGIEHNELADQLASRGRLQYGRP